MTAADALSVIAEYVRAYPHMFARNGAAMLTPDEAVERRHEIEIIAGQIDALARSREKIRYQDFEPLLEILHQNGFFPDDQLISAFAQTVAQK